MKRVRVGNYAGVRLVSAQQPNNVGGRLIDVVRQQISDRQPLNRAEKAKRSKQRKAARQARRVRP